MSSVGDITETWHGLGTYQPGAGYDEMVDPKGGLRPHWEKLLDDFTAMGPELRGEARGTAERLLREHDVTFTKWTDEPQTPWRLDVLPMVIGDQEWRSLARALEQRARLANALVADLYGDQNVLRSGALPPAIVFGNPEFQVPCNGYEAPGGIFLQLLAFDLGRSPDGKWWVLDQLTDTPSGVGYALENRIVTSRCLADLFEQRNVRRLAGFFRDFGTYLRGLAPQHLAVVLSGGLEENDYFEHAFIARYLGYPLVEGADLTVRRGRVFLKTLRGLESVDLILRRLDSANCDPLDLRAQSNQGVAGLLQAARRGNVITANAIGTGVIENDAIQSFLPGLCSNLLGEELRLPSVASWWCGHPDARDYVLANHERLALRSAFRRAHPLTANPADHNMSDPELLDRERLEHQLQLHPHEVVGREQIALSTIPMVAADGSLSASPMTMRVYVAATAEGYRVMPGGVAKVVEPTSGQGYSKDVWILSDEPVEPITLLTPLRVEQLRRSDEDLPSKTADDLFWLGRYIERGEGAVRLYRSLFMRFTGEDSGGSEPVALEVLTGLLVAQELLTPRRARRALARNQQAVGQELWNTIFDEDSLDGLPNVLRNVERTAEQVRERLSSDAWRVIEKLTNVPSLRWRVRNVADAVTLLNDLLHSQSAVYGLIHENMTRGYGWRFLNMGQRIERAQFNIRVLRALCVRADPDASGVIGLVLELLDSTMTYRSRYHAGPELTAVLDLVLADHTNPRSLLFQLQMLVEHLEVMPLERLQGRPSTALRTLLQAHSEVGLVEVEKLATVTNKSGKRTHLDRVLQRTAAAMTELTERVGETYFTHATGHRVTGLSTQGRTNDL